MIRRQLSRGASSFVHLLSSERGLASKANVNSNVKGKGNVKAKGNQSGGTRASTRAAKENKVPTTQRIPSKLSAAASASIQPQNAVVPDAYLSVTGSPNVYLAKCATEEFGIDAQELFLERTIPPSFRGAEFHYMSPKLFDHKPPKYDIPEVAVLGRSNVGKSTLINAIMRKNLAKSSKQPGRTQTVHYYGLMPSGKHSDPQNVSSALGFLIDLPGYGFAKAPDKNVASWQEKTQDFLLSRRDKGTLTRTLMLVDSRRGTSQFDRNIMGWFDEAEIPYTVVLTKADRVSLPQLIRFSNDVCMRFHSQLYQRKGSQGPLVHVTSSSKNSGIEELMATIDANFVGYYENRKDSDVRDDVLVGEDDDQEDDDDEEDDDDDEEEEDDDDEEEDDDKEKDDEDEDEDDDDDDDDDHDDYDDDMDEDEDELACRLRIATDEDRPVSLRTKE